MRAGEQGGDVADFPQEGDAASDAEFGREPVQLLAARTVAGDLDSQIRSPLGCDGGRADQVRDVLLGAEPRHRRRHPPDSAPRSGIGRMSMPFLIVRSLEPAIPCARESAATSSETHTNRSTSRESCRKMAVCRRVAWTSRPCRVCTTIGTRASRAAGPA